MRPGWDTECELVVVGWTAAGPRFSGWPPCGRCGSEHEDQGADARCVRCTNEECGLLRSKLLIINPATLDAATRRAYAELSMAVSDRSGV